MFVFVFDVFDAAVPDWCESGATSLAHGWTAVVGERCDHGSLPSCEAVAPLAPCCVVEILTHCTEKWFCSCGV